MVFTQNQGSMNCPERERGALHAQNRTMVARKEMLGKKEIKKKGITPKENSARIMFLT